MSAYLNWLVWFAWLPTLIVWLLRWRELKSFRRLYLYSLAIVFPVTAVWDILSTSLGIWSFPAAGSYHLRLLGLPPEEYLFIISMTFLIQSLAVVVMRKVSR